MKKNLFSLMLMLFAAAGVSGLFGPIAHAQASTDASGQGFAIPGGLRGKVEFWKNMFVKYGKNQRVFHHREHPEIVYSVLDLSHLEGSLGGKQLLRAREREVKAEIARIQDALKTLAATGKGTNALEKKIEEQFTTYGINRPSQYLHAADIEFIRYQAGIKERFREGLIRSGRYLYAIEQIFRSEGLPVELGRLPLVESSFDYEAYSSAGAAGIWQFVRSTGSRYLRIDAAVDERRDPILATRAAAKYLKNAHKHLQSWPLTVTSYNHGLAGMIRAAEQTGTRDIISIINHYNGKTFGFASKNFYAEFLAAAEVERNAQRYFPGLTREAPLYFNELRLGRSLYFSDLLRLTGCTEHELFWLNRSFRDPILQNRVPVPAGFALKVPPGKGAVLEKALSGTNMLALSGPETMEATIKDRRSRNGLQMYTVQKGDTVGKISARFGVSQAAILSANKLKSAKALRQGRSIIIPDDGAASSRPASTKQSKADRSRKTKKEPASARGDAPALEKTYKVVSGDNLSKIAKKTGIKLSRLQQLNPKAGAALKPGQELKLE